MYCPLTTSPPMPYPSYHLAYSVNPWRQMLTRTAQSPHTRFVLVLPLCSEIDGPFG